MSQHFTERQTFNKSKHISEDQLICFSDVNIQRAKNKMASDEKSETRCKRLKYIFKKPKAGSFSLAFT